MYTNVFIWQLFIEVTVQFFMENQDIMNCTCLSMLRVLYFLQCGNGFVHWNSFVQCYSCRIYQLPLLCQFFVLWPFIKAKTNHWVWLAIETNQPGQETKGRVFDIF